MTDSTLAKNNGQEGDGIVRRDFLSLASCALGAVGGGFILWPFLNSMEPAADALALSTTDADLGPIALGQRITVMWQGKPVFLCHRTPEEIAAAQAVDITTLRDPQKDTDRVQKAEWLVVVGVCTHLGCIPNGQKATDDRGNYGGWHCPCHGSEYDTSGRRRFGPAPLNLAVPKYAFTAPTALKIG